MNRKLGLLAGLIGCLIGSGALGQIEYPSHRPGVATVVALRAGNFVAAQLTGGIRLEGYYAPGDGGGGNLQVSTSTACSDDGVLTFKDLVGHCITRENLGWVSIKQGGAKCDSTGVIGNGTNDTTRINVTSAAANAAGYVTRIPATGASFCRIVPNGVYAFELASGTIIRGEGMGKSRIFYDDTAANIGAIQYDAAPVISNVTIEGLSIKGSWDAAPGLTLNATCLFATHVVNIVVRDFECYNLHGTRGITLDHTTQALVDGAYIHEISGNGFTCEDCYDGVIVNSRIIHTADDGIAFQMSPTSTVLFPGLIIANNYLQDTFGIKALGVKGGTIANNVLVLPKIYCFYIGYAGSGASSEGYTSSTSLAVTGNSCSDVINGSVVSGTNANIGLWLFSYGQPGSTTIPWRSTGAAIVAPWAYNWINGHVATTSPVSPGAGLVVQGNTVQRTQRAVATYSSYGLNPTNVASGDQIFASTGWVNPAITDALLTGESTRVQSYLSHALIVDNTFLGGGDGATCLSFSLTGSPDYSVDNVIFRGNSCYNTVSGGVQGNLGAGQFTNLTIEGNFFDCDPFAIAPTRLANGKWMNSATPSAIDIIYMKGVTFGGNHVRNCLIPVRANGTTIYAESAPNILHLNPVAIGYNANNVGIGSIPAGHFYVIENGDPASAAYGSMLSVTYSQSDVIPAAGTWVAGTFVRSTAGACGVPAANRIVMGWERLTTGTGNATPADWLPVLGVC